MSDKHNDPADEPPGEVLATEPQRFPDCRRVAPWDKFAARWSAKREDHDRFVQAINTANSNLPRSWRLPDDLAADWLAEWADDLFIGIIPQHDRLTREEVTGAVGDVAALVEALRFVARFTWIARANRFWFYELADNPGLSAFPTIEEVQRYRPELDPRCGVAADSPATRAIRPYCDQRQFFERASFLLGTPTPEQLAWLCRLASRPDPLQPLWTDPPRHHTWAQGQLQRVIPELAGLLHVSYPQIDNSLPIHELIRRVHNWIVEQAKPAVGPPGEQDGAKTPEPIPHANSDRTKRSTEPGEARRKLIAALSHHHRYAGAGNFNPAPAGNNELAKLAEVEKSTTSAFFKKEFDGHTKYKALCLRDPGALHSILRNLNDELPGHELVYGRRPDNEDDRDDEE